MWGKQQVPTGYCSAVRSVHGWVDLGSCILVHALGQCLDKQMLVLSGRERSTFCWTSVPGVLSGASHSSSPQEFTFSCRSATAPMTPQLRGGTAATAVTRQMHCPARGRRSPGCRRCAMPSCSSTSSTCRAWASFWSRCGHRHLPLAGQCVLGALVLEKSQHTELCPGLTQ